MSIQIVVDPMKLETGAQRIEQQSMTYDRSYARIYQAVEALSASWQGKDNQAFVTQIKGFQNDFAQLSALMKEDANFLKISAKVYRDTQEERTLQARRLGGA